MDLGPIRRRRRRRWPWVAGIVVLLAGVAALVAFMAGYFDRDPINYFDPDGQPKPVAALYFSGDMGLRLGIGSYIWPALASEGVPVTGFNSPSYFSTGRSRAEVERIVATAIRQALARHPDDKLVLIGQSYGADILQTGLAALPPDLRPRIAGLVLVVPGETVYFRADPSSLAYHSAPDSLGESTANTLTWLPVTCIYGAAETDSLCPKLRLAKATVIRMPGGHFLGNDHTALIGYIVGAIKSAVPDAFVKKG
ncbi:type IV secretory pathway VirJ component [Sphingomonas jinjuensis]|uniref:Type IV secretory pathway VirJ component n=1 Tax=Sphingomonas jinjuensis TaxID=535907 RepID=A0A840F3T2_9SPHN|nr:AcvB/VirJ family lysyl-phosphatidylglycerol hydrolase [Sphingomonas jinjuensis]MBB4152500.1 type IV secretory pathway VirJ component [Sphingomonas jinjuensis]